MAVLLSVKQKIEDHEMSIVVFVNLTLLVLVERFNRSNHISTQLETNKKVTKLTTPLESIGGQVI